MIKSIISAMSGMGKKAGNAINSIAGSSAVRSLRALAADDVSRRTDLENEISAADSTQRSADSTSLVLPQLFSPNPEETFGPTVSASPAPFSFSLKEDVMVSMRTKDRGEPVSKFDDFKRSLMDAIPAFAMAKASVNALRDAVIGDREFVIRSGTVFSTESERLDLLETKVSLLMKHGKHLSSSVDANNALLDKILDAQRKETLRRKRQEDEEQVESRPNVSGSLFAKGLDALRDKGADLKDDVKSGITAPLQALASSPLGKGLSFLTDKLGIAGAASGIAGKVGTGVRSAGGLLSKAPGLVGRAAMMAPAALGALGTAGSAVIGGLGAAGAATGGAIATGASALGGLAAAAAPALVAAAPFIAAAAGVAAVGYGAYKLSSYLFGKDEEDLEELRAERPVEDPYCPQLKWISEKTFFMNNPEAYEEFQALKKSKVEEIEEYGVVKTEATWQAKQVAINNFADEIIQAKAGEPSQHYTGDLEYTRPRELPDDLTKPSEGKPERKSTGESYSQSPQTAEASVNAKIVGGVIVERNGEKVALSNSDREKVEVANAAMVSMGNVGYDISSHPSSDLKVGSVERPSELRGREIPSVGASKDVTINEPLLNSIKTSKLGDFTSGLLDSSQKAVSSVFSTLSKYNPITMASDAFQSVSPVMEKGEAMLQSDGETVSNLYQNIVSPVGDTIMASPIGDFYSSYVNVNGESMGSMNRPVMPDNNVSVPDMSFDAPDMSFNGMDISEETMVSSPVVSAPVPIQQQASLVASRARTVASRGNLEELAVMVKDSPLGRSVEGKVNNQVRKVTSKVSPVTGITGRVQREINQAQGRMNNSLPGIARDILPNVSAKIEEMLPNVAEMKEAIGAPVMIPLQRREKGPTPSSAPSGSGQNPPSLSMSSAPTFNTRDVFRQIKDFI